MARVNRDDIVSTIAKQVEGLNKKDIKVIVDMVFETMKEAFKLEQGVQLVGFGTFKPVISAARLGINPQTKKRIKIKEKRSVRFKVSPQLKAELNEKAITPVRSK
jgi:DNA-binding protein HU-beta